MDWKANSLDRKLFEAEDMAWEKEEREVKRKGVSARERGG